MAMNKKFVKMRNDKRAEMGVGTMIIFIAMVLVAAVAASVLISTANTVREQAQNTGDQAITNVASGFSVQDVTGLVEGENEIKNITMRLRLQAGSPNINMNDVMIVYTSGDTSVILQMRDGVVDGAEDSNEPDSTHYVANKTLDSAGTPWATSNYVVAQGDLITINICNDGGNLKLGYAQDVTIKVIPAYGSPSVVNFMTPTYYSTTFVSLR